MPILSFLLVIILSVPAFASSLMDARLSANFHYIPILSDSAEAITFYGHNTYADTAIAQVQVKIYNSNGTYKSSPLITRFGWDAVSGEGDDGLCRGKASIRAAVKATSIHKGKIYSQIPVWEETSLAVYN